MSRRKRPAVGIVGAGHLARALIPALADAGYPIVAVAATRIHRARSACRGIPAAQATTRPERAIAGAALVLLALPDGRIAELARQLASIAGVVWRGRTVLHHAGALGTAALEPLARSGADVGVLHPMQALGDPRIAAALLRGSHARIEGSPGAQKVARKLAADLGLIPLRLKSRLSDRERIAYHTAASIVANDLVALLAAGSDLLGAAGVARRDALRALAPLARGVIAQAEARGLGAALTGPVARGDVETVRTQLEHLASASHEIATAHRSLSARVLELALAEGVEIPPRAVRELRRLLRDAEAGRGRRARV